MSGSERILVAGAGVIGLWQAIILSRAGHAVTLCEQSASPYRESAASRYAGAMLAPWCEAEAAPDAVRDFGIASLDDWRGLKLDVRWNGSLVVAAARDASELRRFAQRTSAYVPVDAARLSELEPALDDRFGRAVFFPDEGHMPAVETLERLLALVASSGVDVHLGTASESFDARDFSRVVDSRGMAARSALPNLRGVRGERLIVRARDVQLTRPVRLLHPRHPIYVVPGGDNRYVIGATVIENEEDGLATVRSVLELLGAAYALHPAFGEAEIIDVGAGVRPAFPDNIPRVIPNADGRLIFVNGAYRHGFLLAPALGHATAELLADPRSEHPLIKRHDAPVQA